MKTCTLCLASKPLAEFVRDGRVKDGRAARCRPCRAGKQRAWVQRNPKAALDADMMCKYGITSDDKKRLMEEQGNKCKGCETQLLGFGDACVDHCHKTGVVRGILCHACNTLLGRIEASPGRHVALISYLAMLEAA